MSRSLMECNADDDFEEIKQDNFQQDNFSLLSDGFNVYLSEQALHERPSQKIQIPKKVFDYLIRKYEEPQ
jgi:hypothetical protein